MLIYKFVRMIRIATNVFYQLIERITLGGPASNTYRIAIADGEKAVKLFLSQFLV